MDGGFEALWGSMVLRAQIAGGSRLCYFGLIGLRGAESEGVVFWVGPLECRKEVVEVRPPVHYGCNGWEFISSSSGGVRRREPWFVSMTVLDDVPFILPGLTLDSTKFEQFAKVHNLILRVETAFKEEIVVDLEHG
jgi:hypothetical protein